MFITNGHIMMTTAPQPNDTNLIDHQLMNNGTQYNVPLAVTAQAIWDRHAILATDGSVRQDNATYAWIISTDADNIEKDIAGGGILPPSAQYTNHVSKRPEAAALYAALTWIATLLK